MVISLLEIANDLGMRSRCNASLGESDAGIRPASYSGEPMRNSIGPRTTVIVSPSFVRYHSRRSADRLLPASRSLGWQFASAGGFQSVAPRLPAKQNSMTPGLTPGSNEFAIARHLRPCRAIQI